VTLSDISKPALEIANYNADNLGAAVSIISSDLLQKYLDKPDVIIANLPYVDDTWKRSPETDYEPRIALFAKMSGFSINEQLIDQASKLLKKRGYLIIEADPCQHQHLIESGESRHLIIDTKLNYILSFRKL
jgi:release factor glutamine methyltransferase